jgi:hypothetical protein
MKTTRYKFETAIQAASEDNTQWLKDEFKSVLESDKDFTRKCDYIGFSIASIDSKVTSLDEEIKELQQLKKNLKSAKDIALTIGAEVFAEYGIEKIEGAGISSITLTKPTTKMLQNLEIVDEDALIAAGYYKKVLDEDAVKQAFHLENSELEKVMPYANLTIRVLKSEAKLKINKRRGKSVPVTLKEGNNTNSETLQDIEEAS